MRKFAFISRLSYLSIALLLLLSGTFAQTTRNISGIVLTAAGLPLSGASVSFKGEASGVTTNADGKFTLPAASGKSILVVSYVGYISREVPVEAGNMEIRLTENPAELSNVVVIGYGIQKKSDLTGSVASIKESDLSNRSSVSAVQALQGKAAGVQIVNASGAPGSEASIQIRGYSSNYATTHLIMLTA